MSSKINKQDYEQDLESYTNSLKSFERGEIQSTQFRSIRVPMGLYEQRESGSFMMRLRIPGGGNVTADQLLSLAELSNEYGSGILHLTTRQDIQLHGLALSDTPLVMRRVNECGLSTKGGGGNTVRNVTSCVDAGVCRKEIFDVSNVANQVTDYLVKDARSLKLPRKFKVAVSGCPDDCSLATLNDVGFIAKKISVNGEEKRGFAVYVAGGMGSQSAVSRLLYEFIPFEEIGFVAEAVKRVFDKKGNRRNKNKARLRFLYKKLGKEEFESCVKDEFEKLKTEEQSASLSWSETKSHNPPIENLSSKVEVGGEDFALWKRGNTEGQKQDGYCTVTVRVDLGEIPYAKMSALAEIVKKFELAGVIVTHDQNFLLKWVPEKRLASVFAEISKLGLGTQTPVSDVLCCAGASTCRLGICLSRGVSSAISEKFGENISEFSRIEDVKIHVSGCPNSCGQHAAGKIGLVGSAKRVGDHLAPFYTVSLGGRVEEGYTKFGDIAGTVHARYIPDVLSEFLREYSEQKSNYKDFYDYVGTRGFEVLKTTLKRYGDFPSFDEDPLFYRDWGSGEEFSLAGRGPGECGAGVFDMIDVDLEEAEALIEKAFTLISKGAESPAAALYEAVNRASRALLVTRGVEAKDDLDGFQLFEKEMIQSGHADKKYQRLLFLAAEFKKGYLREESLIENSALIKEFISEVKDLYQSMDDSLQFRAEKNGAGEEAEKAGVGINTVPSNETDVFDLRGVACPFNYVKTKLKLEDMEVDGQLQIFLDDGAPIKNVPNSLRNDGQEIVKMERRPEGFYELTIKKKV